MKLPKLTEDSFCLMLGNNDVYLKHPGNIEAEIARRCNMWDEMVEALRPLARFAQEFDKAQKDDRIIYGYNSVGLDDGAHITIGDCRKCDDLLARATKEPKEN